MPTTFGCLGRGGVRCRAILRLSLPAASGNTDRELGTSSARVRRAGHRTAPQSGADGGFVLIYSDIWGRKRSEAEI